MIIVESEPLPKASAQARKDFAIVTNTKEYDPPYWFKDTETGMCFKGIYGCIGWPGTVDNSNSQPEGYAAIIAVDKKDNKFRIMEECQTPSPELLINKCLKMRDKWGFGVHPSLFQVFIGDHLRFELIVAQVNTRMVIAKDDSDAFIISPPDDFENTDHFDIYFRRLQFVADPENVILLAGKANIFKDRLTRFERNEPAVLAVGGLIHTLLGRKPWMVSTEPSVFSIPDL